MVPMTGASEVCGTATPFTLNTEWGSVLSDLQRNASDLRVRPIGGGFARAAAGNATPKLLASASADPALSGGGAAPDLGVKGGPSAAASEDERVNDFSITVPLLTGASSGAGAGGSVV